MTVNIKKVTTTEARAATLVQHLDPDEDSARVKTLLQDVRRFVEDGPYFHTNNNMCWFCYQGIALGEPDQREAGHSPTCEYLAAWLMESQREKARVTALKQYPLTIEDHMKVAHALGRIQHLVSEVTARLIASSADVDKRAVRRVLRAGDLERLRFACEACFFHEHPSSRNPYDGEDSEYENAQRYGNDLTPWELKMYKELTLGNFTARRHSD